MIEKPNIEDEKIIIALNENYSIQASEVEFLPAGNDTTAFAYRVGTKDQIAYFLKIKKGILNPAGLFVPQFLKDNGIEQIIAPLSARSRELWVNVDEFALILYPFITGNQAMKVGMSDTQWTEFGSVLRRIHEADVPSHISSYVSRESFFAKWSLLSKELQGLVDTRNYECSYQDELATFWRANQETIQTIIARAEMLGRHLQDSALPFVLCHADIHTANVLLTPAQDMFIVDWDDTLLAPKERDLMFVLAEDTIHTQEEQKFFDGYGPVKINQLAMAYYRYEWCVQEIADFGNRVFLMKDAGERTKQESVAGFMKLFSQGDVIDAALHASLEI